MHMKRPNLVAAGLICAVLTLITSVYSIDNDQIAATAAQQISPYELKRIYSQHSGDPLNFGKLSLVQKDGKKYVRAFQALFSPTNLGKDHNGKYFKDIWQDNGKVTISFRGQKGAYTWFGLGENPLRQFVFINKYTNQIPPAACPMIKEVLIELNPLLTVLNEISTEEHKTSENGNNLDINVDRTKASNQLGLTEETINKLRPYMRDLTTYVENKEIYHNYLKDKFGDSSDEVDKYQGEVKTFKELRRDFQLADSTPKFIFDKIEKKQPFQKDFERYSQCLKSIIQKIEGENINNEQTQSLFEDILEKDLSKTDDVVKAELREFKTKEEIRALKRDIDFIIEDTLSYRRQIKSAIWTEVILQIGEGNEVQTAVSNLKTRYEREGKKFAVLKKQTDGFIWESGHNLNDINFDKHTRFTLIGHQFTSLDKQSNNLLMGYPPEELGKEVLRYIGKNEKIGKIRFVTCNPINDNFESVNNMMADFVGILMESNIKTSVSIPVGYIQVDREGRKLYGMVGDGGEISWLWRDSSFLVRTNNKKIEYGVPSVTNDNGYETIEIKWQDSRPSIDETSRHKLIWVTEEITNSEGNINKQFDLNVSKKRGRLRSIVLADASGALDKEHVVLQPGAATESSQPLLMSDVNQPVLETLADEHVEMALGTNDAHMLREPLETANAELSSLIPPDENWVPLIDSAVESADGRLVEIALVNPDTEMVMVKVMKKSGFLKLKKYSNHVALEAEKFKLSAKSFIASRSVGLFGIMGLAYSAAEMDRYSQMCQKNNNTCPKFSELSRYQKAVRVFSIYGLAEGSFGITLDGVEIGIEVFKHVKATQHAVDGAVTVSTKFLKAVNVIDKVGLATNVLGVVGGAVGLGFSIHELVQANTTAAKLENGLQVAFGAVSFVTSTVATTLGISAAIVASSSLATAAVGGGVIGAVFGAAAAMSAAGPVGIIAATVVAVVASFASIFTSLAFEFKATREAAGIVGDYFFELDKAYHLGGFNHTENTLIILPHAIVTKIDILKGEISLDSQYIYSTEHGCPKLGRRTKRRCSGYHNYFLRIKDFPKIDKRKSRAINIREVIQPFAHKALGGTVSTLLLPLVPKSYISYQYSRLPFCTAMKDRGFDILRKLEKDYRFDYDFYIVPGEQIISGISHEYVRKRVDVILDSNIQNIVLAEVPKEMQGFYDFHVEATNNGHVNLILYDNKASFTLRTRTATRWLIDARNMPDDTVSFVDSQTAQIGKYIFTVSSGYNELYVRGKHGGLKQLNFNSLSLTYHSFDYNMTENPASLERYLRSLDDRTFGRQEFVLIVNYRSGEVFHGNAFYEVKSDRILYSDLSTAPVNDEFKNSIQMLGKVMDHVYFMSSSPRKTLLWWADAESHTVGASYEFFCGEERYDLFPRNLQQGVLYMIQSVFNVTLIYAVQPYNLTLISVEGSHDNVLLLADTCFPALKVFFQTSKQSMGLAFPGACIYAISINILPLRVAYEEKFAKYMWLKMDVISVSDEGHENGFCKSHPIAPTAFDSIEPNIAMGCENVSLWHMAMRSPVDEGYFFVCNDSGIYYQVNDSEAMQIEVPGGFDRFQYLGLTKYVKSKSGALYLFHDSGTFTLAAVSSDFLRQHAVNWLDALTTLQNHTSFVESAIPLLDIYTGQGKPLSVWYSSSDQTIYVVSPLLVDMSIEYIGQTESGNLLWLYDRHKGAIILQKKMEESEIVSCIRDDIAARPHRTVWTCSSLPEATIAMTNVSSFQYLDGNVLFVTSDNELIVSLNQFMSLRLLGVTQKWLNVHMPDTSTAVTILRGLCASYNCDEVIELGSRRINDTLSVHTWFHCYFHLVISVGTSVNVRPQFLGFTVNTEFLFSVQEAIVQVPFDYPQNGIDILDSNSSNFLVNRATLQKQRDKLGLWGANIIGDVFDVKLSENQYFDDVPLLEDKTKLVLGIAKNSFVNITKSVVFHYTTIVITVCSHDIHSSVIVINGPEHCNYTRRDYANIIAFQDELSGSVVILNDFVEVSRDGTNVPILTLTMCSQQSTLFSHQVTALFPEYYTYGNAPVSPLLRNTIIIAVASIILGAILAKIIAYRCSKRNTNEAGHIYSAIPEESNSTV